MMHAKLIEKATKEQLGRFLLGELEALRSSNPDMHKELECGLYESIYGKHFCDWLYEEETAKMANEDGSSGAKWSLKDISDYAKSKGERFTCFNEYDLAYAMNMVYSDYYGSIPDTTDSYYKVATAFLNDKDAPEGKAYLYWRAMRE